MANRILRLTTSSQILQGLTGFLNKKINIVQTNNVVLLAELKQFSGNMLLVKNMRGQHLSIDLTDIYEIIIDLEN